MVTVQRCSLSNSGLSAYIQHRCPFKADFHIICLQLDVGSICEGWLLAQILSSPGADMDAFGSSLGASVPSRAALRIWVFLSALIP